MTETNSSNSPQSQGPRKRGWTIFWLVLVVFALIGQTAAIYIPAFAGETPDPTRSLPGTLLWFTLYGVLLRKLKGEWLGVGAGYGLLSGVIVFAGAYGIATAYSDSSNVEPEYADTTAIKESDITPWVQSELEERFMRTLTKEQCVLKSIEMLKTCDSQKCIQLLAGVLGDCVEFSQGNIDLICADYRARYIYPNCESGDLSANACNLLEAGNEALCTSR